MPASACRAPGASSAICIRSMTCRPGARPTTPCCPRCRVSTPILGRIWPCSPSSSCSPLGRSSPRCRRPGAASSRTSCAISGCRAPNCPKTASRASRKSRKRCRRWVRSFPRTCWMRPTRTASGSPTRPSSPACPRMRSRRRGPPPRKMAGQAGNSPCMHRPTCRCCSSAVRPVRWRRSTRLWRPRRASLRFSTPAAAPPCRRAPATTARSTTPACWRARAAASTRRPPRRRRRRSR